MLFVRILLPFVFSFNALVPYVRTMSLLPGTYFEEERERAKFYQRELVNEEGQSLYRKPFYLRFLPLGSSDEAYQKVILKNIIDLERASGLLTDDKQRQRIALYISSGQKVLDTDALLCLGGATFVTLRTRNQQSLSLPFKGPLKHANPDVFPSENFHRRYPVIGRLIRAQDKKSAQFRWLAFRFSLNFALASLGIGLWNLVAPPIPSTRRILGDSQFRDHFARWRAAQEARVSEPRSIHDLTFRPHRFLEASSEAESPVESPIASSAVGVFSRQNVDQNPQWSRMSPKPSGSLATSSIIDSTDSGIFDDDASPIASQHRGMDNSERKNQAITWDEIRRRAQQEQHDRGNTATSGQRSPHGQQQRQQKGQPERHEDDESFISRRHPETDRQKAQREFDALLEEERRGGSQFKKR